jgi:hypothetical protein
MSEVGRHENTHHPQCLNPGGLLVPTPNGGHQPRWLFDVGRPNPDLHPNDEQWRPTQQNYRLPAPSPALALPPITPGIALPTTPAPGPTYAAGCSSEDIEDVSSSGEIVILMNGHVWEIGADSVDTALWLPAESVLECNGFLVNIDQEGEKAEGYRIR